MRHRILRNVLCCALLSGLLIPATAQLQSKINFNLEQQVQIESLAKEYEKQGLDFKQALMKAEEEVAPGTVTLRTSPGSSVLRPDLATWPTNHAAWLATSTYPGSIEVDRDATIHGYLPSELVKKVLLKTYSAADEARIQNVSFKGWNGVSGGGDAWMDNNASLSYKGNGNRGLAYFHKGSANFDIEKGLLLSTSDTWGHEGPNELTAAFGDGVGHDGMALNYAGSIPFDIDIKEQVIITSATLGGLLEFDFCPAVGQASFDYIFGSDEYPEWTNTQYNDGFGFFVSGPYETASEAETEGQNQTSGYTSTTTVSGLTLPTGRGGRGSNLYDGKTCFTYYQYNIAQLPNGDPVSVNWTNWGRRNSSNTSLMWAGAPWDSLGVRGTGGGGPIITIPGKNIYTSSGNDSKAMNPEYHRAIVAESALMELDGITIKLTAVADSLIPGKWYHMKMVICQKDWAHGDGVFLGNLDLGQGTAGIDGENTWDGWPAKNDSLGLNNFYVDCIQTLKVNFEPQSFSQIIEIVPVGAAVYAVAPDGKALSLLDTLFAGDEDIILPFKVDGEGNFENGAEGYFITNAYNPATPGVIFASDTTDIYKFYKRFTTNLKYRQPTVQYAGSLELNIKNGSPNLFRSLNGGQTWENAYLPFSQSQIANFVPDEDYILLKEPNSCWLSVDSVYAGTGEQPIMRSVDIPEVSGATTIPIAGRYFIDSRDNFVLTITPTGANAGMVPVLTTNRTSIPDSEGVVRVDNGDGSYTFTIKMVQEPITISLDFATGNASIENGDKVWSDNGQLYVTSTNAGHIRIFNAAGTLFKTFKVTEGETIQTNLGTGLYIVTINDRVYKAFVK